jgi:hypothetical protein
VPLTLNMKFSINRYLAGKTLSSEALKGTLEQAHVRAQELLEDDDDDCDEVTVVRLDDPDHDQVWLATFKDGEEPVFKQD